MEAPAQQPVTEPAAEDDLPQLIEASLRKHLGEAGVGSPDFRDHVGCGVERDLVSAIGRYLAWVLNAAPERLH